MWKAFGVQMRKELFLAGNVVDIDIFGARDSWSDFELAPAVTVSLVIPRPVHEHDTFFLGFKRLQTVLYGY